MDKKMTYEKAMSELQSIIDDLENDKVKVDHLPEKVKKANQLLQFCRTKLKGTEEDVMKLMDE